MMRAWCCEATIIGAARARTNVSRERGRLSGYALVELVVAMSALAVVLTSVSVVLGMLWRAQGDVQSDLTHLAVRSQLLRQLRADAHAAESVSLVADARVEAARLVFLQHDGRIEYARSANHVVRSDVRAEQVVHREMYALGDGADASWIVLDGPPPRLQVAIRRRDQRLGRGDPPIQTEQVEAVIGYHARTEP
jgi:hypothetical protein